MSATLINAVPDAKGATVKAIQMTKHGSPEVLHFLELPDPKSGPGEVLLKVEAIAGKVVLKP